MLMRHEPVEDGVKLELGHAATFGADSPRVARQ